MTKKPPEQIWLQWYGEDDGNNIGINRPEGPTFSEDRVYSGDVPYVPLARAEAAEGKLESTLAIVDLYQNRMFEAEARVAELEAHLAANAGEWRRVTDDEPAPLQRVVIETNDGADVGWRLPEMPHYWSTRRGRSYLTEEIHGFIEIPPPQE